MTTIDAHVYTGPWAFRYLPHAEPEQLLRRLDRAGVDQALVSATEAILYKDPQQANELLASRVNGREDRLRPVVVLNPRLAGWEEDWRACLDQLAPVGLRLLPSYHAYSLPSSEAAELLDAATEMDLPIFLVVRIEDERIHHHLARVRPVPVEDLAATLRARSRARFVVCGARLHEIEGLRAEAPLATNYAVEISHCQHPIDVLERLRELLPAERIWLGSGAPFLMPEPALYKVTMARLTESEKEAIVGGNAARELARVSSRTAGR